MRTFGYFPFTVLVLLLLLSCKKGEEDPAFTLLSRKARVVGEWTLASAHFVVNSVDENMEELQSDLVMNESSIVQTIPDTANGQPLSYLAPYSLTVKFSRNGEFTMKELVFTDELTAGGTWAFNSGVGAMKNKEEINFLISSAKGSATNYHYFNQWSTAFSYRIKGLHNNKMTLLCSTNLYIGANGEYLKIDGEVNLVQE